MKEPLCFNIPTKFLPFEHVWNTMYLFLNEIIITVNASVVKRKRKRHYPFFISLSSPRSKLLDWVMVSFKEHKVFLSHKNFQLGIPVVSIPGKTNERNSYCCQHKKCPNLQETLMSLFETIARKQISTD